MDRTKTKGPTSEVVKRLLLGRAVPSEGLSTPSSPRSSRCRCSPPTPSPRSRTRPRRSCACCSSRASPASASPCRSPSRSRCSWSSSSSSYRQTVRAYPNGGGSYIVSKENLGTLAGLLAAAALLTDYVLTVAVSVVAGVFALISARSRPAARQGGDRGRVRRPDHAREPPGGQASRARSSRCRRTRSSSRSSRCSSSGSASARSAGCPVVHGATRRGARARHGGRTRSGCS